jgi:hypothetical protein
MGRRVQAKDRVTIKIPRELYDKVAERIEGTGFRSVSEFIIHVIRDVTASGKLSPADPSPRLDRSEIELVRDRLRALGYID